MKKRTRTILTASAFVLVAAAALFLAAIFDLNREIRERFDGQRWSLPAVIYARPLELYPGLALAPDMLERELQLAGYRREDPVSGAGGYSRMGDTFHLTTREFAFPSGVEESSECTVHFHGDRVSRLSRGDTQQPLPFLRLDPARIGSIHPLVHEDRLVLESGEIPALLKEGLRAVEDKSFYDHHGISPTGIARALVANIQAGRTVQGGSTITQQLVKNLFLGRERTLKRKAQEALMALLLEWHYSKEEILTAYINEVFLGQDGNRAVHGFGLASQFYFRRSLKDLSTAQTATLIGMVKGPSHYDPRRNSDVCRTRRNVVLRLMLEENIIDEETYRTAIGAPVIGVSPQKHGFNRFPAFLDLVRRQLESDYREEDLQSGGLRILTTLDPQVQWHIEEKLAAFVDRAEERQNMEGLQGAAVVTSRESGEVLGVAGGAFEQRAGFNRALDARRPIGSLVKPAVYLTALSHGYTLASALEDRQVTVAQEGADWKPRNSDGKEHGRVLLYRALAQSYNLATVRLGLDLGVREVIATINRLGYPEAIKAYPSLLLGSLEMSPVQVAQIYQTIGSGGFYQPLRSITSVLDQESRIVTRYGLKVDQRFAPEHIFLLNHGLERVMSEGTGRGLPQPEGMQLAGKTGTSDKLRDSWFAGYSDSHLAVVWLGRDDNAPIGLTGSTGAAKVWASLMTAITTNADGPRPEPENISWIRIDRKTLDAASILNSNSTLLPFVTGTGPAADGLMPGIDMGTLRDGARSVIESVQDIFQ